MIMIGLRRYGSEHINITDFPPFIRVNLERGARKELFLSAMKEVKKVKREYKGDETLFMRLYGEKKGNIFNLLLKGPQPAQKLIEASGLSPSAVYHFLGELRKQHIISKKGHVYSLEKKFYSVDVLPLSDIVKLEEDPALRRKYGISIAELEVAHFLWDRYQQVAPKEGGYAQTYHSVYTLADAIHRWRTGRTDTPVWALEQLTVLSGVDINKRKSVNQYHFPPGIAITPYYENQYTLPIVVDSTLDKIVVQLLQKMSKNHLYTFPKRKKILFESLHRRFGEFDDSTARIPSAITEILKSHYKMHQLKRSSARIPSRMRERWSDLTRLIQIEEESSLLLHVVSLSSRSNGGFEITSRSKPFLHDISRISSDLGLGTLTIRKKHNRPHYRAYLSESKLGVLKRYAHLSEVYPDLQVWTRIPLNKIGEKLVVTGNTPESIEHICYEELKRFTESILKSLEKRKRQYSYMQVDYLQYTEEITDYFWERTLIPSPKRVEQLVKMRIAEEEQLIYA
jgi:hypothetical protein